MDLGIPRSMLIVTIAGISDVLVAQFTRPNETLSTKPPDAASQ